MEPITKKSKISVQQLCSISQFHIFLEQRNSNKIEEIKQGLKEEEVDLQTKVPKLEIIYKDDHLIVVNKPVGHAVHQAGHSNPYQSTMLYAVRKHVLERDGENPVLPINVGLPHRLDKETSGVLIFGKNTMSVQQLNNQFSDQTKPLLKQYCAIAIAMFPDQIITQTSSEYRPIVDKFTSITYGELDDSDEGEDEQEQEERQDQQDTFEDDEDEPDSDFDVEDHIINNDDM
ncbi:RNA pseudouridine synthase [Acrasis kona]|uniref:RNA pseudouridine synthase n=1 Tax=Acrasis kona TaxID=1008807 RepID=A0AAW2YK48_9EUKA